MTHNSSFIEPHSNGQSQARPITLKQISQIVNLAITPLSPSCPSGDTEYIQPAKAEANHLSPNATRSPPFLWGESGQRALANLDLPFKPADVLCIRIQRAFLAEPIAVTLWEQGSLKLALWDGNATLLVLDRDPSVSVMLQGFRGWHTHKLSAQYDAGYKVLFANLGRKLISRDHGRGVTGKKRGQRSGWSPRSLQTNRKTCEALFELGLVHGVVTIGKLPQTDRLKSFQDSVERWLRRQSFSYHGVWEGPEPHMHILFCSPVTLEVLTGFATFCRKRFLRCFTGCELPTNLVEIDLKLENGPEATCRYLSKHTYRDSGVEVKGRTACPWLTWAPYFSAGLPWEQLKAAIEGLPPTPKAIIEKAIRRDKSHALRRRSSAHQ